MSKVIRKNRLGRPCNKKNKMFKIAPSIIPSFDTPVTATVKSILHERGRGAPLTLLNYKKDKKYDAVIVSVEGTRTGQNIEMGDNVPLSIGNITRLKNVPEGTLVSSVERIPNDGGKYGRSGGCFVAVVAHNKNTNQTIVRLPSGIKKTVSSEGRAVIGIVAGGGRTEKPILKAGRAYYKYKSRSISWPVVRGVAMNPVDHPHGGGNHQHIGHPSTVSRHAPHGQKVGLIAARRTGLKRGSSKELVKQ
ncbi:ribosomal protein L8 [Hamiltosporidium tvaerminnensis]|uniref:Ribosomal protein L8 n=2 Tax=Hamiltosporidium TaxID=1176354 RepID=A0A4Q9LY26_9MICR|nr:60S ribosomal protein L2 [Hamiltosporidium tvaerminnensis]TBU04304.1 ribosomal protein L8 [Hamiltosporidium tvaerminnensis]TBU05557.1 ribosomal protein L8 [Hamiltosporidium magnivora]TBU06628.1 ribosomal protein L8 [Hamiltosporidium tvaerminnensis]TBU13644.1 ribosomal protein L8 [Hamiltosporidium tvaerminnensis]